MKKNILLITVDALRGNRIGHLGYNKNITPNLDRISKKGFSFTNAFTNAPYTTPAISSLLTSTLPLIPDNYLPFGKNRLSFAKILKDKGYFNIGIHSNPWFSVYDVDEGFDIFIDMINNDNSEKKMGANISFLKNLKSKLKVKNRINKIDELLGNRIKRLYRCWRHFDSLSNNKRDFPYEMGGKLNKKIMEIIDEDKNKSPKFIWAHYMDVHTPYIPYNKKQEIKVKTLVKNVLYSYLNPHYSSKEMEKKLFGYLYDISVQYIDNKIGELYDWLSETGRLDNFIIIITSDHGDELGEHGNYGHVGGTRTVKFYEELLKIPMIIIDPSQKKRPDLNCLKSLVDIGPTILDLLEISKPESYMGQSVFNIRKDNDFIISQGLKSETVGKNHQGDMDDAIDCIRTEKYKLIRERDGVNVELYNLENDPNENENLVYEFKLRKKLEKKLNTYLRNWKTTIEKNTLEEKMRDFDFLHNI